MAENRRELIADAAIALLAREGLRSLTHRAVDREAGLPNGSTSYYASTRLALIELVAHRLADRSARELGAVFAELERRSAEHADDPDRLEIAVEVLDGFVQRLADRSEDQRARYALMIDLVERESIRGILSSASPLAGTTLDVARGFLARLGVDARPEQVQNLVLLTDGLVFALVSRIGYGYLRLDTASVLRAYLTAIANGADETSVTDLAPGAAPASRDASRATGHPARTEDTDIPKGRDPMSAVTERSIALLAQLRAAGVATAYGPDDPEYRAALAGFNTAVVHSPALVVAAGRVDDVVETVRFANEHSLEVYVVGRGHGALAPIVDGIALATAGLASVDIDAPTRTAVVGAGASWADVLEAASPHGLAPLCGSAPHVGVVGYLLGGGIGPVARTFGFAADHVRSISVVTADGGLIAADPSFNPDLFWALRGGKGGFGVVVSVEIDLFPLAGVYGGGLYFAEADAPAIVRAYPAWSKGLPEELTSSIALLRLPPLPQLPEPLRGRFVAHLRIAYVGPAADAEQLLNPIRAVADPIIDAVGELPYAQLGAIHSDPVDPMPVADGGILLADFDQEAADALVRAVGPSADVPLAAVEIRHLGGALGREPEEPNAVGGRDAAYSLHIVGAPVPELLDTVIPAVVEGVFEALAPWATGGTQINFVGRANRLDELDASWPPAVRERLRDIRRRYDPEGRFPFPG
ncbi:FAD-binding protein [Agromyces protaetiae]|uniref:FAD-binding protein n=1 Tax=Agromyces protaetiae TaxID=2509455 RepID=A0A4P6F8Y7_9MICO|nr:FAD-binding protein [Agromyces protaetiae]QAY72322.1 FAD-binding protein [Agromyces protaetiae]